MISKFDFTFSAMRSHWKTEWRVDPRMILDPGLKIDYNGAKVELGISQEELQSSKQEIAVCLRMEAIDVAKNKDHLSIYLQLTGDIVHGSS